MCNASFCGFFSVVEVASTLMKIGVLDIQGSVVEHCFALERAGAEVVRVKNPEDLEGMAGLVMPGGESTTIGKLMKRFGLWDVVIERVGEGMAVWGTCAGAILLEQMGLIDIKIERNAYGRQLDSFETEVEFGDEDAGSTRKLPAVFIRAPKIVRVGERVKVLAQYGEDIVAARCGKILVTTFHPEMAEDLCVQEYFLQMCE